MNSTECRLWQQEHFLKTAQENKVVINLLEHRMTERKTQKTVQKIMKLWQTIKIKKLQRKKP